MRLFIAIPLNDELKRLVRNTQAAFRAAGVRGNYTPQENLHLTLAFIGEFEDPDLILEAMDMVEVQPIALMMDRLGRFDDLLWMGFAENAALDTLVKRVRRALAEAGIPFDRKRFLPHVTILRRADIPPRAVLPQTKIEPRQMEADRIVLFCSTRGKNGMIYTEVGSVPY